MKKALFALLIILPALLHAQPVIDRVVAIVDEEIILQSELDFRTKTEAMRQNTSPDRPGFKKEILNAMIEEKLLYAQAILDSIAISDEELTRAIDYQIDVLHQQFGSKEKIEQTYGMPIEKIRREIKEEIRKNLLVQRLTESHFGKVESSRREVEDFYQQFKDSLGTIPEKVTISHIFRNPGLSETIKLRYRKIAENLLDSIKTGADFADLARRYSDDPGSAKAGGELGFVKKGVFYPEFESAAFALSDKQISDVVESPVGFHIIQLLDRRGESISTRHILIKVKADDQSDLEAIEFLGNVRDSISRNPGSFAEYAKKYSHDKESARFGGSLGTLFINQLERIDKGVINTVSALKEGEVSYPKRVTLQKDSYGYHIVFLEKRIPPHLPDLEVDFTELKRLADEYKKQKMYAEWMTALRNQIFWQIKVEDI